MTIELCEYSLDHDAYLVRFSNIDSTKHCVYKFSPCFHWVPGSGKEPFPPGQDSGIDEGYNITLRRQVKLIQRLQKQLGLSRIEAKQDWLSVRKQIWGT